MEDHLRIVSDIEEEVLNAKIEQEVNRCKFESAKGKDKSDWFHDTTRNWIIGRQKILALYETLPEEIVEKGVKKEIFPHPFVETGKLPRTFYEHKDGASPLQELMSLHQKVRNLREILEDSVKTDLDRK